MAVAGRTALDHPAEHLARGKRRGHRVERFVIAGQDGGPRPVHGADRQSPLEAGDLPPGLIFRKLDQQHAPTVGDLLQQSTTFADDPGASASEMAPATCAAVTSPML